MLAGALASVALAWILFDPGGDASRVYYGTDTHAVGLLVGVALALVWSPIELRRQHAGPLVGPILDAVGVLALAYIVLSFLHVHDYDLALWHGGYLWLALFTALLLAVLAHPAARLGGLLGQPPLLWLGLRSYSFYLWHWPVLALTRPGDRRRAAAGVLIPLQLAPCSPSPSSPTATSSCPSAARRSCPAARRLAAAWRGRRWSAVARSSPWSAGAACLAARTATSNGPKPRPRRRPTCKPNRARDETPPPAETGAQGQGEQRCGGGGGQRSRRARQAPPALRPAERSTSGHRSSGNLPAGRPDHRPPPLPPGSPPPRIIALGDSVMIGADGRTSPRGSVPASR